MRPTTQKLFASALSIIVLANSLYFVLPEKAHGAAASADGGANDVYVKCGLEKAAKWALSIVKGTGTDAAPKPAVSVSDGRSTWQKFWDDASECLNALWNTLIKIAFNKFKKRLLDRLTDDTIAWISGKDSKPKFITDFNSVLRNSADAALGDTIQALGAGKLCNTKLSVQLQLNLQAPKNNFSDNVSCTLSSVVKNVSAFSSNFQNGSWIAYNELNSLQNNKYGLQLLAADELARNQAKSSDAVKTETASSKGFLSTKMCVKWSVIGQPQLEDGTMGAEIVLGTFSAGNNNSLIDPSKPPATPPTDTAAKIESDYPSSKIKKIECKPEDQKITTPGETLATILGNSFEHDNNAVINADDLTPYLSAIFDAAFNRLTKEGVRGLSMASKDLFSQSGQGKEPTPYSNSARDQLYAGYGSQVVGATTAQPNTTSSSTTTSGAYSLASSTLKTINTVLSPLITEVQALYTFVQTSTSLLAACEAKKTDIQTQCQTTTALLSKLAQISSDIDSTNSSIELMKVDLNDALVKLKDPNTSQNDILAISAQTQVYATQTNTYIDKMNADKNTLRLSNSTGPQYQACLNTPLTLPYVCPTTSTTTQPQITIPIQ